MIDQLFKGKKITFTFFEQSVVDKLKPEIERRGGKVTEEFFNDTNVVVSGKANSSKSIVGY